MDNLVALEQDVKKTLGKLKYVVSVEAEAFASAHGRKKIEVTTYLSNGSRDNRYRIYDIEADIMEKHPDVLFEFHTTTAPNNESN